MKANTTYYFNSLSKGIVLAMFLMISSIVNAQTSTLPAGFRGGQTYWVDGIGSDYVLPKDTFVNLTGPHILNDFYTQSTGIISALNNQGVDSSTLGQITIILAPGYSGSEPNLINIGRTTGNGGYPWMTSQRPVVIKPASGIDLTITTTVVMGANTSLVRFNAAQFCTIDGAGTVGQRNLTFALPATATNTTVRVIDFIATANGSCSDLAVKNCRIVGNSTAAGAGNSVINTYAGIYSGGVSLSAALRPSQNISIINNVIEAVQNGIYFRGQESVINRQDNGLVIMNNTIGGTILPNSGETLPTTYIGGVNAAGITLIAQKNATVSGNTVRNNNPTGGNFRGITLIANPGNQALDSNITVNANKIYNLRSASGTSGVYGIRISISQAHTQPLSLNVSNNTIGNLLSSQTSSSLTGAASIIGIMIEESNSSNSGINILHNSVHLYGDTLSAGAMSACLLTSSGATGGIKVTNNIFVNRLGRTLYTTGLSSTGYIYVVNSSVNPFTSIGNNSYHVNNTAGSFSFVGNIGNANKATIKTWSAAVSDNSSVNAIPPFVGTSNELCVISNGAATVLGTAGTSAGITTDINGNPRSLTTPSVGAYEFTGNAATANYSLKGGSQYLINGVSSWPVGATGTGSFATLSEAFTYLNTYGVGGNGTVNLQFTSGYSGETAFIPHLLNYPGASLSRTLLINVASGASVTVSAPALNTVSNQYSLLNLLAAKFVTINGSSSAGQRNLTFVLPSTFNNTNINVIGLSPTESDSITDISISNCNITGVSSTTAIFTPSGIYHGGYNAPAGSSNANSGFNKNITLSNNYIKAVRTGIYFRGANVASGQTRNVTISRNLIGGNITQGMGLPITVIGGFFAQPQAGIFVKGVALCSIDSNIIRNSDSVTNLSNGFRGIDIDFFNESNAIDSAISITRNTIYNLTTASGQYCIGIRVSLGTATSRSIKIMNNSISKIRGVGASISPITSNPAGILIDGAGVVANLDLDIFHNTVRLNGNTLNSNNSSAALFISASIQGGVRVQNNIFMNRLGRGGATAGNAYAVYTGATTAATSPFALTAGGFINGNAYGADASNTTNNYIMGAGATNFNFVKQWQAFINQDFNSASFISFFDNDSTPALDARYSGLLFNGSASLLAVTKDITGATRPTPFTCTGALQFSQDYLPLVGNTTYSINGVNNLPRTSGTAPFSFATISDAINYLNANGVDGLSTDVRNVTLKLTTGYLGEPTDMFIPAIRAYPKMNASRIVTLTTSAGRNDTIRTSASLLYPANGSVIRFLGGSYFEINGDDGSGNRAITITLPNVANANAATLKLIDIAPGENPVVGVQVRNCNLIGTSTASTISTYAAIYMGGLTTTPSSPLLGVNTNHTFENNFIGAVRYGVYAQGVIAPYGQQDKGITIKRNIIGSSATYAGNTLNWGGATNAAGIFLSSQANALVDSNVITNNINTFANNRGIELSSANQIALSVDTGITIARNTISGISNTTATGGAYGIYMSFADTISANDDRGLVVKNNMISNITAPGTQPSPLTAFSSSSPMGIYVEGTVGGNNGIITQMGLRIWNNSINLGYGTSMTSNNAVSACIAFSPNVRGGVTLQNNVLQNRLGKASGTGTAAAILIGHTETPFAVSANNIYYTNAPGVTNIIGASSSTLVAPVAYTALPSYIAFTRQDTMSLNFITKFVNDSNLLLSGTSHNGYAWGAIVPSVSNDIQGDARNPFIRPTIGADELSFGSFVDSIAPRIYNVTKLPLFCTSGSPIQVMYRVFERTSAVASDTLYYRVNNGPELSIIGAASVNEFTRVYNIPTQPDNTSIAYRLAVRDNASFRTVAPATGYDYTSTSFNTFPITYGFDLPNLGGWTVDNNVNGNPSPGGWDLNSYGSSLNPVVLPKTGLKAALFPAASLPDGSVSRIVSPCLDFTNMKVPTVRIWVSQNGEALSNNDLVQVTVSGGFNIWSAPLGAVVRPNSSLVFPEFTQLDVCLSNFVGLNGMRVGIEGISKNGMNIVLDSIVIFDDVLNQPITPLTGTVCAYNPLSLNIPSSSNIYSYTLVDTRNGLPLGPSIVGNTNGSGLNITAPNPSNPAISRVDSVRAIIQYTNSQSGCKWQMPDTATIVIKNFYGGPFMTKGSPFKGVFGLGTFAKPDGAKLGDVLTYTIEAPSGLTNADYGTKWTVVGANVSTPFEGRPLASFTYTAATPSTKAFITANPTAPDLDSTFKVSATIRFLPSNCDSTVVRYVKVSSSPTAAFINASDSVCSGAAIYFTNTSSFAPNTAPITYTWTFGDGTSASTGDANKIYAFDKAPGLYTVTLRATNNAGVFDTISKTIRVLPAPLTTYTSGLACGTDALAFTNTTAAASSYLWTVRLNNQVKDTSTSTNPSFSFAIADTVYNVTLRATNTLGCFRDSTRGVFAFAKPVASFTTVNQCAGTIASFVNSTTINPGGSSRVNTFGSFWDFGNGSIGLSNSPVYKYPTNGTYTVKLKVTSNFGCTDSTTRSITIFEKPVTAFTTGIACQDDVVSITNNTSFSGGLSKLVYAWDFGDFSPISSDPNPVKTFGGLGNFTIQLIAHDTVNNCYDTTSKTIEVNEVPLLVGFSGDDGCKDAPVSFNNSSIPPDAQTLSYSWTFGDGGTATTTNPSHTYLTSGQFKVTLRATTNKGCFGDGSDSISIDNSPSANFTIDSINCNTLEFTPGLLGAANYRWDFGDSSKLNSGDGPVQNVFQTKGTHRITLTVTSANGCSSSHSEDDSTWCTVGFEELFASKFNLSVYPNPFSEMANISYKLDTKETVTITVMDLLGRTVSQVVENNQSVGLHTIQLDHTKFGSTSAMYMVRIQIGDEAITKQLVRQ
jgi:PKD repeat protein